MNGIPQVDQLLGYLLTHGTIDPMTALDKLGIYRLAARIKDLRDQGHVIETDTSRGYAVYTYRREGLFW